MRRTPNELQALAKAIHVGKARGWTNRKIAAALGISPGEVHKWAKRFPVEGVEAPPAVAPAETADDDSLTDVDPQKVTYLSDQDLYLVHLRGDLGTQALKGSLIRALRRDYSHAAGSPTMKEVAHKHGLTRNHLDAIRSAFGWTKNDLPVTDEELRSKPEAEVVEDVLALKAQRIELEVEKRLGADDRRDAARWRDSMVSFGRHLTETFGDLLRESSWKTSQPPEVSTDPRSCAVVLGLSDWHYGMFSDGRVTRSSYDTRLAVQDLHRAWDFIRQRLPQDVTDIILPISGDLFHVDNEAGETTKGTPQDVANDVGLLAEGFLRAMRSFVETLRFHGGAGVTVHLTPVHGNHDSLVGKLTMVTLSMLYEGVPNVRVHLSHAAHNSLEWRDNLLFFSHGDGLKPNDMPLFVAAEHAAAWGSCLARVGFSGHVHHEIAKEFPGFKHYTMPALSGTDRWHAKKGYHSQSGMMAYLLEPALGVVQQIFAPSRKHLDTVAKGQ